MSGWGDQSVSQEWSVKEAEHIPEKLVNIKERSWRTDFKFNQVTEEKFEKDHEIEVYDHLKKSSSRCSLMFLRRISNHLIDLMIHLSEFL